MRNRAIFAGHMFIFALAAIAAIFYLQSAIPIGVGKGILAWLLILICLTIVFINTYVFHAIGLCSVDFKYGVIATKLLHTGHYDNFISTIESWVQLLLCVLLSFTCIFFSGLFGYSRLSMIAFCAALVLSANLTWQTYCLFVRTRFVIRLISKG